jgi:hypothetical protein
MKKLLIHALGAEMGEAVRHLSNFLPELGKQDLNNYAKGVFEIVIILFVGDRFVVGLPK